MTNEDDLITVCGYPAFVQICFAGHKNHKAALEVRTVNAINREFSTIACPVVIYSQEQVTHRYGVGCGYIGIIIVCIDNTYAHVIIGGTTAIFYQSRSVFMAVVLYKIAVGAATEFQFVTIRNERCFLVRPVGIVNNLDRTRSAGCLSYHRTSTITNRSIEIQA